MNKQDRQTTALLIALGTTLLILYIVCDKPQARTILDYYTGMEIESIIAILSGLFSIYLYFKK